MTMSKKAVVFTVYCNHEYHRVKFLGALTSSLWANPTMAPKSVRGATQVTCYSIIPRSISLGPYMQLTAPDLVPVVFTQQRRRDNMFIYRVTNSAFPHHCNAMVLPEPRRTALVMGPTLHGIRWSLPQYNCTGDRERHTQEMECLYQL